MLPLTKERALEMLEWGANPSGSPYSHLQIAEWCDQHWRALLDVDVPVDLEVVVQVLGDVECQWDLYVASAYPELANDRDALNSVRMPLEWFNQWARQVRA
jgi:hypothetical protein